MMIRSKAVLDSARGQPCSFRFPGICGGNPETTVWAHLNGGQFGKGMGIKAHDILGAHSCFQCHRYLDTGHGTKPLISNETLLECVLGGVTETWVRLIVAGIVTVPQDKVVPAKDRKTKPRKAKGERAEVAGRLDPWPKGRKLRSQNNLRKRESGAL